MFTKELANKLIKMINERDMTLESLAEASHLSRKYVGNIISMKQVPSLYSFEKICTALQVNPNDLLISDKSNNPEKLQAMQIKKITHSKGKTVSFCPDCSRPLEKEYQAFCDRCGRKLSWSEYSYADKIDTTEFEKGFK